MNTAFKLVHAWKHRWMHPMNQLRVIHGSKATHIHRWERKVGLASQALWAFVSRIICWINLLCRTDTSAKGKKQKTNLKSGKSPIVAKRSTSEQELRNALDWTSQNGALRHGPQKTESGEWLLITPGGSYATHSCSLTFPWQDGGQNWKGRGEKPHGLRWDSSTKGKNKTKEE